MDIGIGQLIKYFEDNFGKPITKFVMILVTLAICAWAIIQIASFFIYIVDLRNNENVMETLIFYGAFVFSLILISTLIDQYFKHRIKKYVDRAETIIKESEQINKEVGQRLNEADQHVEDMLSRISNEQKMIEENLNKYNHIIDKIMIGKQIDVN